MAEMSNYLEAALLNATLRNTSYTSPSTVYVSLHTADPTDAGTGAEVAGNSYARTSVTFAAPSSGTCASNADCTFPQATGSWGTITHIGLWDANTTGNLLYHTPLASSKTIDNGDLFKIASGSLTVTLD
jgi:hypothetical protein